MNKLKIALVVSSVLCAGAAQANFTGFGAGLGGSIVNTKMEYTTSNLKLSPSSFSPRDNGVSLFLDLSYGFSVTDDFVTTVGATYAFNSTDSGKVRFYEGRSISEFDSELKNHYSIYVAPGYKLSSDSLVYGKLAYHGVKSEHDGSALKRKITKNHTGFGFGVGYAYAFSPELELAFEVEQVLYNKKSENYDGGKAEAKPVSTISSIVFKYRF